MYYDAGTDIEIKRRRKLAEALQKAGQQPEGTQMVSGLAVPNSPLAGLASAISSGVGQYQESQADKMETEQARNKQKMLADAIGKISGGDYNAAAELMASNPEMADSAIKIMEMGAKRNEPITLKEGEVMYDPVTKQPILSGPPKERKLSSTEQKEFFDATDGISTGENAINVINEIKSLRAGGSTGKEAKPFSGAGAMTLAGLDTIPILGSFVSDERAAKTKLQENLTGSLAVEQLKSLFGGMPTEGERKVLMDLQALPSFSEKQQQEILDAAERVFKNRLEQNRRKASAIESGDRSSLYKNTSAGAAPIKIKSDAEYDSLPQGAKFIDPDGKLRSKP